MKHQPTRPRQARRVVSPQQAAFELKHRVILSLNKLADRDTNQIAVDELERTVNCLAPEGIGAFLSCIVETDSEQKSAVRKECVRIMGVMARSYEDLMGPHLGKMVGSIVKRLKDTDTVVRDACVEAVGVFASCVVGSDGGGGVPFDVLAKPLFEALGEQNRYVQAGAALCLAKVVDECSKSPVQILQPMLSRVIKLLKNPHFMAKAALVELVRSIIEAGGASSEHVLSSAITSLLEALKNTDWTTRKAASTALASISLTRQTSLSSFKVKCIQSLESCRFDKVKPVRDSVMQALQCWKGLPEKGASVVSDVSLCTKENYIGADPPDVSSVVENGWKEDIQKRSPLDSAINVKRQRSPLSVRKSSAIYNVNREPCIQKDWQIEISLPKTHSSCRDSDISCEEPCGSSNSRVFKPGQVANMFGQDIAVEDYKNSDCSLDLVNKCYASKELTISHGSTSEVESFANHQSVVDDTEPESLAYSQSSGEQKSLDSTMDFSPRAACNCGLHASKELSLIRKQLTDLKEQQSDLFNLLQAFMGTSMSNMSMLQSKVHSLECAIEKISQNVIENVIYPVPRSSKNGMKNQSVSSSPRLSTCTPRQSMDTNYQQSSLLSVRNSELWEDSASSKSQSVTSGNEYTETRRNSSFSLSRDALLKTNQRNSGRGLQGSGTTHIRKTQDSYSSVCIPRARGKVTTLEGSNSLWKRIKDFMHKEDNEAAYLEALCADDEVVLIELMNKTGPVLEKLSDKLVNEILCTLAGHILDQKFLGSIIPWLQQVVDFGPNCVCLSTKVKREMLLSIQEASSMDFCSPAERSSLAQIGTKLRYLWCEENSRCMANPRKITGRHF